MIIDMHCHALPGLDDGAKDEKETVKMLRMAWKEGIRGILVTPHYNIDREKNFSERCREAYRRTRSLAEKVNPRLRIFLGNEIYYSSGVVEALQKGEALPINGTRYVLIEFAPYVELLTVRKAVQEFLYAGYFPILAHMERYECLRKINHVQELVELGAFMQVNASSLEGKMGIRVKWYLKKLIRADLVHVIGTDAHGSRHRRPKIRNCLTYLDKKAGVTCRKKLTEKNPAKIIRGEHICGEDRIK